MGSPPESPFKADEPVSTSRKWIILAAIGLVLSLSGSGYAAVTKFDLEYDTVWRTLRVVIEAGLAVILVRAALAAGRCRKHRSFDMMATALRAQRPFWVLLTVFAALGSLGLGINALLTRDQNQVMKNWLQLKIEAWEASHRSAQP